MNVQDYSFYHIVGTCKQAPQNLAPLLALINDLNDGERIAYFAYSKSLPSNNVGIVVGIRDFTVGIDTDLTYIGFLFARYGIVPEETKNIKPDVETDLTDAAAFTYLLSK